MKRIYKFLILTVLATGTMFYSCETLELEELASPNALAEDQADPALLFNNIQLSYRNAIDTFNAIGGDLSRSDYMFGRNYFNNFGPNTMNGPWASLYTSMIPDIAAMEAKAAADETLNLSFHIGASKTMQAHLMMLLVDYLGDIVWDEAFDPDFPQPIVDDDASVYTAAEGILAEGKGLLQSALTDFNNDQLIVNDILDMFFAQGSPGSSSIEQWIRLARTIKMRADLTTGEYDDVIAATNVLGAGDDFYFEYGTNELNPDTRHPDYDADYRSDGANIYQSNWLMDLMAGDFGELSSNDDPRRRYYFFRQNWRTPGNFSLFEDVNGLFGPPGAIYISSGDGNGETLQCSLQETPTHLQFTPDEDYWCSMRLGYWGRAHGNDEGTPPDNFLRTASGVYPVGGSFDGIADAFPYVGVFPNLGQQVGLGRGAQGAGILPVLMASYVDFWKAEAYLASNQPAMATMYYEAGITNSIDFVAEFGARDATGDYGNAPDDVDISDFIANKVAEFDSAPTESVLDGFGWPTTKGKWDLHGEQYFIAMYGGAADGWNYVRRTGGPDTMMRSIEEVPGPYPRTLLYPTNEAIANPNITQRTDNNTQVFWDSGATSTAN
ncbi:MAG: SusD/RagB family nutrient-binding outer membrane lipoprotein [Flavobacteriaceae bacterium]|nr:SusD/RagB family nutrient-binding outer membrane lipoprotein [Flavobacteriaceae bacterium]